jgi:hypothetical protein
VSHHYSHRGFAGISPPSIFDPLPSKSEVDFSDLFRQFIVKDIGKSSSQNKPKE